MEEAHLLNSLGDLSAFTSELTDSTQQLLNLSVEQRKKIKYCQKETSSQINQWKVGLENFRNTNTGTKALTKTDTNQAG